MKKTSSIALTILLIFVLANTALSDQSNYVSTFIGASSPTDSKLTDSTVTGDGEVSYDIGYLLGVAIGHDFGKYRLEGEVSYQKNDTDEGEFDATYSGFWFSSSGDVNGDITLWNLFGNFYWDIISSGPFTPYLTTGLGLTSVQVKGSNVDEHDAVTSIHVGAGVRYFLIPTASLDIRYRYQITSDFEFDTTTVDFSSHSLSVGINWAF